MGQYGIGQPVRRKEDVRLLTGKGQYTDDINIDGQAWAAFVRSSHANAKINGIDATDALALPGVVAVYTGFDLDAAGIGTLPSEADYKNRDGSSMHKPERKIMPTEQTRFVGEVLAIVVAETGALAGAKPPISCRSISIRCRPSPLPHMRLMTTRRRFGPNSAPISSSIGNMAMKQSRGED